MSLLVFVALLAFAGGYVASIFTWDKLHAAIIGVENKAAALRQQAKDLVKKV